MYFLILTASALKCWRCSSDASNAAFCGDPFDASIITEPQRRWGYTECSQPPQAQNPYSQNQPIQRTVCKKIKQISKCLRLQYQYLKRNSVIKLVWGSYRLDRIGIDIDNRSKTTTHAKSQKRLNIDFKSQSAERKFYVHYSKQ